MFKLLFLFIFFGESEGLALFRRRVVGLLSQNKKTVGMGHRGRLDIIADILEACCDGTRKTYLMYRCNLSFKQLKQYLIFLLKKGFLCEIITDGNPEPTIFKITDKGKNFLKAYKGLQAFLG